jgi:DNA polymerase III epsilon subunit-like protein
MKLLFYDLETTGLDTSIAAIMQMAVMDENNNVLINSYIYPYDGIISGTNIHGIDENKLKENNALECKNALENFINIIKSNFNEEDIYLIAYNNFGYDQQVLEYNLNRFQLKLPDNWYFTDLYPYFRYKYRFHKFENFKLSTVFQNLIRQLSLDENHKLHDGLFDVIMLKELYDKHKNEKYIILNNHTRQQLSNKKILFCNINLIDGYSTKCNFKKNNINLIGDLMNIYNNLDEDDMNNYLNNNINIKQSFYRNKVLCELKNIKYLCNI